MTGELETRGAREHAHPALGEAIGGIAGHRPVLVHRCDVDDATAAALLDHLAGGDLRAEERALEIDAHHLVVLGLGGVEHRRAGFDTGVVDHDIEPAEPLHCRVHELLQIGGLADVGVDADGLITQLGDLLFERRRRLRMSHVVDDDRGALPRQFENDRLTDPAVAAGDDRNFVLQRHSCSSIIDVGSFGEPLRHAPAGMKAASVWVAPEQPGRPPWPVRPEPAG